LGEKAKAGKPVWRLFQEARGEPGMVYIFVIPIFRRLRQEDHKSETSLGNKARPCLKNKTEHEKESKGKTRAVCAMMEVMRRSPSLKR
jgi:hypothetical protein